MGVASPEKWRFSVSWAQSAGQKGSESALCDGNSQGKARGGISMQGIWSNDWLEYRWHDAIFYWRPSDGGGECALWLNSKLMRCCRKLVS